MLATGAVFLSCCQCVRATGYGLARPSIFEWVGVRRIDRLLFFTEMGVFVVYNPLRGAPNH